MTKIAVTGGSGAIGTYVCDELLQAGHDVTSLDLVPPSVDLGFVKTNLTSLEQTRNATAGFDQVVRRSGSGKGGYNKITTDYGTGPNCTALCHT